MKFRIYLSTFSLLLLASTSAFAQDEAPVEEKKVITLTPVGQSKIVFEETEFDFGAINQGETVTHVFKFVNEGSAPLVISRIKTPCGCTAPSWSKEPIAPGDSGEITVSFNSTGKVGNQIKALPVIFNSEMSPAMITIKATVKPPTE